MHEEESLATADRNWNNTNLYEINIYYTRKEKKGRIRNFEIYPKSKWKGKKRWKKTKIQMICKFKYTSEM